MLEMLNDLLKKIEKRESKNECSSNRNGNIATK